MSPSGHVVKWSRVGSDPILFTQMNFKVLNRMFPGRPYFKHATLLSVCNDACMLSAQAFVGFPVILIDQITVL